MLARRRARAGWNGSRHHGAGAGAGWRRRGTVAEQGSSRGSLPLPLPQWLSASPDTVRGGVRRARPADHLPACPHTTLTSPMHIPPHNTHTQRPHSGTHYPKDAPGPPLSPGSLAAALPHFGRQPSQKDRRRHPKFKFSEFHCNFITFTHFTALSMIYHIDFHYYYNYQEGTLPSMGIDQRTTQHTLPRPPQTRY